MAKAQFQRHQRVWVECVGTWATIDKVTPVWAKGFDEPVRITYDVGLGREFLATELQAEPPVAYGGSGADGLWAASGVDHDRDPTQLEQQARMEHQARLIAAAPQMARLAQQLVSGVGEAPEAASPAVRELAREARRLLAYVNGGTSPDGRPNAARTTDPVARAAPATDGAVGALRQNL
jgi:hypothetical protein